MRTVWPTVNPRGSNENCTRNPSRSASASNCPIHATAARLRCGRSSYTGSAAGMQKIESFSVAIFFNRGEREKLCVLP